MINNIYKSIIHGGLEGKDSTNIPKEMQLAWAKEHEPAGNDYDIAYVKYQCRKWISFKDKMIVFCMLNIASFFLSVFFIVFYLIRGFFHKEREFRNVGAVILKSTTFNDVDDILPKEELKKYNTKRYVVSKQYFQSFVKRKALNIYFKSVLKHPWSFYYHFVVLITLADYTRVIETYHPLAIFTFADEKHFGKPLATLLCEQYGVIHNCFMHGECFFQLEKGFLRFSTYFTWDLFYTNLFREMHCTCPICEYIPDRISSKSFPPLAEYPVYFTYYESSNNEESLKKLGPVLRQFLYEGKKCLYRPHPRFANMHIVRKYIPKECIQDPKEVSVNESIAQSEYLVSICSTVLFESLYAGKKLVVDDYCDVKQYDSLTKKGYIVFSKPHYLFSELIQKRHESSILRT